MMKRTVLVFTAALLSICASSGWAQDYKLSPKLLGKTFKITAVQTGTEQCYVAMQPIEAGARNAAEKCGLVFDPASNGQLLIELDWKALTFVQELTGIQSQSNVCSGSFQFQVRRLVPIADIVVPERVEGSELTRILIYRSGEVMGFQPDTKVRFENSLVRAVPGYVDSFCEELRAVQ